MIENSSRKSNCKVSIITVVFNNSAELEETIKSVISQNFIDKEFLIIDGGSDKKTIDVIKKYKNHIDFCISENDLGIYDAMNKGINNSRGKWINFMNAGDLFYENNTIEKVFSNCHEGVDIIVGNTEIAYKSFSKIFKPKNIKDWKKGHQFIHQSTFIHTSFQSKNLYNINSKIGADFEFFYKAIYSNKNLLILDQIIAIFKSGGVSDTRRIHGIFSNLKFLLKTDFSFYILFFYLYRISLEVTKYFLKLFLPQRLIAFIQYNFK
jgi:glycosyltransferase involved in cell wall biosynthesis